MSNTSKQQKLIEYRQEIDKIDQKIIDLLNERMEVVSKVGKYKEDMKDMFFIKSNREADMIKNLTHKVGKLIPKSVIVSIWRKIITSANVLEQDLKIGVNNPRNMEKYHFLIKEYYGDFVPIINFDNSQQILSEIEAKKIQLGVFVLPNKNEKNPDYWWVDLAKIDTKIKVFAQFPFVKYEINEDKEQDNLVVVANKDSEKSTNDKTLLTIKLTKNLSSDFLKESLVNCGFDGKIIANTDDSFSKNEIFYLVEIDSFFEQNDNKIKLLENYQIQPKVIGYYPTAIILESPRS